MLTCTADRRPIDPTPIVQLNVIDGNAEAEGEGKNGLRKPLAASGMNHLQSRSQPLPDRSLRAL
jgi:hypothetical protein